MKIAILGFGKEGQSLLRFLQRSPEFKKSGILVLDKDPRAKIPRGVQSRLGKNYLSNLLSFDVAFRTPGVRYHLPEIQRAMKHGVAISSPMQLFFEECPTKNIIGVTGTKGKGTTSTLIYQILKAAGEKVFLAGNIGLPAIELLPKLDRNSWIVLELSSFQLIDMTQSPHIAVALMVTSEHLDWHKDTKEYANAKANIVRHQSSNDIAVLAEDYPRSRSYARRTRARIFMFSRRRPVKKGTYVRDGAFWFSDGKRCEKVCPTDALRIPGRHNWDNATAAITVGKVLKIPNRTIARAISRFKGLEHRLEFVRSVNGVRYYNDSYSTTPETAEVAIEAFAAPKILILGGSHKGSDFRKLGRAISQSQSIKAIIGIGAEWPRIKSEVKSRKLKVVEGCKNMREVVQAAHRVAAPGDVVLLSPACASFGMFKNYTDRGKQFKRIVRNLK